MLDDQIRKKPKDWEDFLRLLEVDGYEVKRGKHIALKGRAQKRFIRLDSLGEHYSVEAGDVFFTRTSETIDEVGFSCVCEKTIPMATYAGFVIRVRPYNNVLYTGYAKYYFRSSHHRSYLAKEMNLVTRASLGQDLLKSMPVLVPPKAEQKAIASFLDKKCDEIDRIISQKEGLINKLIDYKKSMIYEIVTGKKGSALK